ncbi:E3 ubiquitin-protein ligase TRIM32-like [Branchiostoma floridae x Branchiostoma japonicum]
MSSRGIEAMAEDSSPDNFLGESIATPGVEAENGQTASIADDVDNIPYAVANMEQDDMECGTTSGHILHTQTNKGIDKPSHGSVECDAVQPYAVRYEVNDVAAENGQTASIADDVDIIPYAVAYMERDDMACDTTSGDIHTQTGQFLQTQTAAPNSTNDVLTNPSSNDGNSSDVVNEERQHAPDALHPNPMYVPNVQHHVSCENYLQPAATLNATNFSPTRKAVSNTEKDEENHDRNIQKITFGERGNGPGKFNTISGVAVSADNEIFLTDHINNRVQVFSINGIYLRLFPTLTAVPGEATKIYPVSVAVDVNPGYLWVVGSRVPYHPHSHVVQYRRDGLPIKTFNVRFTSRFPHPSIAIDVRNNKVIVGEGHTIMMFQPNGSLVRSFEVFNKEVTHKRVGGVVSDMKGNILLTDSSTSIVNYSHSGERILEFGEDQLLVPKGMCVGLLGRIIVANKANNRVDMFTSRGEFVRTVANMKDPWGVAMGPDGQLVVTDIFNATIFPRHMVFP